MIALTWNNIDLRLMRINVRLLRVRSHFGAPKTEASRKPLPLLPAVASTLAAGRESDYAADHDLCIRFEWPHAAHLGYGVEEDHSSCTLLAQGELDTRRIARGPSSR